MISVIRKIPRYSCDLHVKTHLSFLNRIVRVLSIRHVHSNSGLT